MSRTTHLPSFMQVSPRAFELLIRCRFWVVPRVASRSARNKSQPCVKDYPPTKYHGVICALTHESMYRQRSTPLNKVTYFYKKVDTLVGLDKLLQNLVIPLVVWKYRMHTVLAYDTFVCLDVNIMCNFIYYSYTFILVAFDIWLKKIYVVSKTQHMAEGIHWTKTCHTQFKGMLQVKRYQEQKDFWYGLSSH